MYIRRANTWDWLEIEFNGYPLRKRVKFISVLCPCVCVGYGVKGILNCVVIPDILLSDCVV